MCGHSECHNGRSRTWQDLQVVTGFQTQIQRNLLTIQRKDNEVGGQWKSTSKKVLEKKVTMMRKANVRLILKVDADHQGPVERFRRYVQASEFATRLKAKWCSPLIGMERKSIHKKSKKGSSRMHSLLRTNDVRHQSVSPDLQNNLRLVVDLDMDCTRQCRQRLPELCVALNELVLKVLKHSQSMHLGGLHVMASSRWAKWRVDPKCLKWRSNKSLKTKCMTHRSNIAHVTGVTQQSTKLNGMKESWLLISLRKDIEASQALALQGNWRKTFQTTATWTSCQCHTVAVQRSGRHVRKLQMSFVLTKRLVSKGHHLSWSQLKLILILVGPATKVGKHITNCLIGGFWRPFGQKGNSPIKWT